MASTQFILENKHWSYLNLDWDLIQNIEESNLNHPFKRNTLRPDIDLLRIIRDPNNFHFTCKYILNKDILPFQNAMLRELWYRPFPMLIASRGASKSFSLGLYALLRALITQGCKIAITGSVFRQSKIIFEYIEQIWDTAPVLRSLVGEGIDKNGAHHDMDRWWFKIGDSIISAFPIGPDGSKIRGQRANFLISDEFSASNPDIYENVIAGFAFVSSSPIDNVQQLAEIETMKRIGLWSSAQDENFQRTTLNNQSILAGTAYYSWNHFYRYFDRYRKIINSKGDEKKLQEIFGGEIPEGFNWKDYSIMRLPIQIIPEGFMDKKQMARSRVTLHNSLYGMEFECIFSNDSDGFFKRTTIESCVNQDYRALINGLPSKRYVYGIDPAASIDRFSIVILELCDDHVRLVYCWTINLEEHRKRLKQNITAENDFYGYTARKIRSLMKVFPCCHIAMDSQGGGGSVMEALRDKTKLQDGEQQLLMITKDNPMSDGKDRDSDNEIGLHIVELVNFADYKYTSSANHNLKMDLETKMLQFPFFNALESTIAADMDLRDGRLYDTLEDCVCEIEELKDELASIVVTPTPTGKEHWDTPEIKISGQKKGRLRKDRYSALLMANTAARVLNKYIAAPAYMPVGGFVGSVKKYDGGKLYHGPAWFMNKMGNGYGSAVGSSVKPNPMRSSPRGNGFR